MAKSEWEWNCFGLHCSNLLPQDVRIDKQLRAGLRVTVQLNPTHSPGIFALITSSLLTLLRPVLTFHNSQPPPSVSYHHPQRTNTAKVLWWLLMCPGQKAGSTGVTVSVWLPVSVRLKQSSRMGAKLVDSFLWMIKWFPDTGAVFTESQFKEGYDVTIGTSERGNNLDQTTVPPFK